MSGQVAAHASQTDPKELLQIRQRTPVARSISLQSVRRYTGQHPIGATADELSAISDRIGRSEEPACIIR
jgi:hypothetical protein